MVVPRLLRAVLAAVAAVTVLGSCDEGSRQDRFCRRLAEEQGLLATVPTDPGELDDFVNRYQELAGIAPLAIEEQWQTITELVEAVATEELRTRRPPIACGTRPWPPPAPSDEVRSYAQTTCGVDLLVDPERPRPCRRRPRPARRPPPHRPPSRRPSRRHWPEPSHRRSPERSHRPRLSGSLPAERPLVSRSGPSDRLGPLDDDVVDHAVLLRLLGREPAVALGVGGDLLDRLAGVVGDQLGHAALGVGELLGLDGDVGRLAAQAGRAAGAS